MISGPKLTLTMTNSPSLKSILQQLLADGANHLPSCPPLYSLKALSVFLGCSGSPLLCLGFLWLRRAGLLPSCGVRVSPVAERPLWSSGAVVMAQELRGPAACGPSGTEERTCGPCEGRSVLYHWTAREVPPLLDCSRTNYLFP